MKMNDMNGKEAKTLPCLAAGVLVCAAAVAPAEPTILNYDKNANLAKAMEYDLTMDASAYRKPDGTTDPEVYKSYVAKAGRAPAERYYLMYLAQVDEPFQRARVYAKLADLYSGAADNHVAPGPPTADDLARAQDYCRKGLAEAPQAISHATIQMRGTLTLLPDPAQSLAALMDHYEWLQSLNEQSIAEHWLPLSPGNVKPTKFVIDSLLKSEAGHMDTVARSMVERAASLGRVNTFVRDKNKPGLNARHLLEIIRRFPGTKAAEYARAEIANHSVTAADAAAEKSLRPEKNGAEAGPTPPPAFPRVALAFAKFVPPGWSVVDVNTAAKPDGRDGKPGAEAGLSIVFQGPAKAATPGPQAAERLTIWIMPPGYVPAPLPAPGAPAPPATLLGATDQQYAVYATASGAMKSWPDWRARIAQCCGVTRPAEARRPSR